MNNVKLLHIKCCFFQFFNSRVALKNTKKFPPQEKVEMTPLGRSKPDGLFCLDLDLHLNYIVDMPKTRRELF